jgi:hypothetical protein
LTPTPKDSKRRPSQIWQQPLCTRETPSLRRYPKHKQTAVLRDCVANARKTGPRWDPYPRLSIWEPHLRCCSTRRFWETLGELRSLTTSIDFGTSFDAFVPRTGIWVSQLKSSKITCTTKLFLALVHVKKQFDYDYGYGTQCKLIKQFSVQLPFWLVLDSQWAILFFV